MASISARITMTKTQATLTANSIQAIIDWIDTNIRQKLPSDATLDVQVTIIP